MTRWVGMLLTVFDFTKYFHWKHRIIMKSTLASLMEPHVAVMTTCGAISDEVGIMTTLGFLCFHDANFAVTVDATGFRHDNLRLHQWRRSWHRDDPRFSVWWQNIACMCFVKLLLYSWWSVYQNVKYWVCVISVVWSSHCGVWCRC